MKRNIIVIDEEKCNGCGICVDACHESALQLVDGKAKLVSENYCDGLGDCLPECPTGAITVEEREAVAYDEVAMAKHKESMQSSGETPLEDGCPSGGCPSARISINPKTVSQESAPPVTKPEQSVAPSELRQWPCQIKLIPPTAPFLQGASLLIAADCTAFAYAKFHKDFMKDKITIIGCPKLDDGDYAEKFTAILEANELKDVTILRMQVPCCGGLEHSLKQAFQASGKMIPWKVVILSTDGKILD